MVPDLDVSRHHAEIRMTDSGFLLTDVGSVNGTWVDGVRIAQHRLRDGEVIEVGSTKIVFEQDPSTAGASSLLSSPATPYRTSS